MCCVCLERFPTIKTDDGGVCTRCQADSKTPKIYSAGNNMDPGPVPPELSRNLKLCIVANYCMLAYLVQARPTMLLASV